MERRRSTAFTYVAERSLGLRNDFQDAVYQEEASHMQAVQRNYIYDGGMRVWCMELDPVDDRFLLVGTSKSFINLYDLQELDTKDATLASDSTENYDTNHRLAPCCSVKAQMIHKDLSLPRSSTSSSAHGLSFGISAVDWYPIDGGIFVSSSFDGLVKIWDANTFQVEAEFAFSSKVYCAKFSPISSTHSLIAAVTANREVRLCDMAADASIHSLLGHQDEIWSLAWSTSNEFQLCTGSRNGEIRMWDIRRSGSTACLLCLNHEGQADVPGRSSLHTNVKKLPSTSLVTASRPSQVAASKRRRLDQKVKKARSSSERSDPHLAASVSLARAHSAAVNALSYTPDGRFLLSSGHDHRLRLWNAKTGEHQFVNYAGIQSTHISRNTQFAVLQEGEAREGTIVFHPNGSQGEITSYKVHSDAGQPLTRYTAHYRHVTACAYRKSHRELYTGATDGLIMRWKPTPVDLRLKSQEGSDAEDKHAACTEQEVDAWSDDDDDEGNSTQDVFVPPILR
ncbi:hypothetical protein Poli38472_007739 [Pythium oligandrum]|uniref:DNA excision repair protein ERCC-8 n=1 Tax=Pythium oligandrum TaxID=41045 RepID=A0A8K1CSQ9_PYTOL|nr:hypothetical protein Poli38472_007739 [Pythium oligandrum]|eukprot:TMW68067.1 hypothetical protein Poli38472_007739 [Pythium oligandrum]